MMSGRVMSWSRTAVAVRLTRGTGAAQTTLLLTGQTAQSSRGAPARLAGRRQCPVCGALYSLSPNAPTVSEVCDYDGSTLVVRDDDREEVVTERMKGYDRQTTPVLEYFRASGFDVWEVDGAGAGGPQAIAKLIQGMLKDKGYRN